MSKYKDDSCPAKFVRSHLQLLHNLRFILFIDKLVRSVPIIILRANNVMDTTNHRRSAHHSDQSCNTFINIIIINGVYFYSYFKEKKNYEYLTFKKKNQETLLTEICKQSWTIVRALPWAIMNYSPGLGNCSTIKLCNSLLKILENVDIRM